MSRELRRRIAVTLASIVAARLLWQVPVPFLDVAAWREMMRVNAMNFVALPPRSALGALGLKPYLAASVVITMALVLRRGSLASGPREHHVVWLALAIALVQGFANAIWLESQGFVPQGPFSLGVVALSFAAGAMATVGLARLVSRHGIGNGVLLLVGLDLIADLAVVALTGDLPKDARGAMLVAALLPVAWVVASSLVLTARWDAADAVRVPPGARPSVPLRVTGVGIMGVVMADGIFRLPAAIAGFLPPGHAVAEFLTNVTPVSLVGGALFVALSFTLTAALTSWAYDPRGLELAMIGRHGRPPEGGTWVDDAGYLRRWERVALPLALGIPVAVVLSRALAGALKIALPNPLGLVVVASIALGTERQWRLHRHMATLRSSADESEAETFACPTCGIRLDEAHEWCPACGVDLIEGTTCEEHPAEECRAWCIVCRRRLCEDCRAFSAGRAVCSAHRAVILVEGWALVWSPGTGIEAELARARLAAAGVQAVVLENTVAPAHGTLGLYEINRLIPFAPHPEAGGGGYQVLVPPDAWERARGEVSPAAEPHPEHPSLP